MKKVLLCLTLAHALNLGSVMAAPTPEAAKSARFWGKITAVDPAQKTLTVFNRKRQETAKFSWNQKTAFTDNKSPMQPNELAIGQFLMVAYEGEGDHRVASEVAVRPAPFRKRAQ